MFFKRIPEAIRYILREPNDWVRVLLNDSKWYTTDQFGDKESFVIWYHLYENSRGFRRCETHYTGEYGNRKTAHKEDVFFLNSVRPWLRGIRVKGIDSYSMALQQQTMDELAGK